MNYQKDNDQKKNQFIFIKKKVVVDLEKKKLGSWKIVYADFMTALMSFFLVMWIVNATDDDTKKVIENYFNPFGPNLLMASKGIFEKNNSPNNFPKNSINQPIDKKTTNNNFNLKDSIARKKKEYKNIVESYKNPSISTSKIKNEFCKYIDPARDTKIKENYSLPSFNEETILAMKRKKRMQDLEQKISTTLSGLVANHIVKGIFFKTTPKGMLISIIDHNNTPMFDKSSSIPLPEMILILQKIGEALSHSNENISIEGHTDASRFRHSTGDNWKLSLDRAYSTYQILMKSGISEKRISKISGLAQHNPKISSDPMNAANRRIEILVQDGEG
ncbi:flagellar motor protein MotB [Candidatus Liberibacter solanacearum]|uniref:Flagellar motor rotation protein MotB n=1 Tax=Candidatus Liberibacter solanacearum TaxID=556287 RepID=A0A094Z2G3_9HYPH|nr:flagellar motor protein MotB [Candidatus Liberibacter solanacearum]KGB27812.1 flagellar motor protein MotB [Candidatus Liberibacter solanacearum]KJZ81516.1 flagellar motor protein MotB [Candidatus Liberibacter solanacearum]KJZ82416.1 Flagellar motor rotation protein MotB [Candidatus Liberibacter solanacearum]KQC49211.1 flagellar motor protein MotB [Candidatus Liberibacter solanacearum]